MTVNEESLPPIYFFLICLYWWSFITLLAIGIYLIILGEMWRDYDAEDLTQMEYDK